MKGPQNLYLQYIQAVDKAFPEFNKVARTAVLVCYIRDQASKSPNALFQDEYAKLFLNEEIKNAACQLEDVVSNLKRGFISRTAYFDKQLKHYINQGVKQVLILGSGLDTRALRLESPGVTFFEVDSAETFALKTSILHKNNLDSNVVYIAVDYVKDNLIQYLVSQDFNCTLPTFVLWEGNIVYLTKTQIADLANTLNQNLDHYFICLDFLLEKFFSAHTEQKEFIHTIEFIEKIGTKLISGFQDENELRALMGNLCLLDYTLYNEMGLVTYGNDQ